MAIESMDLIRDEQRESIKPPSYVLVLHLNPNAYNIHLHLVVQHVLVDHVGLTDAETEKAIKGAANSGFAVIKPVSKDIGESLVQKARSCLVSMLSADFKVAVEPL